MGMPLVISGRHDRTTSRTSSRTAPVTAPWELSPDAALVVTGDGNGCVLDMNGKFFAVGPVGAEMLRIALESGPDAAVARIAGQYGVDPERVLADLDALVADMQARGILLRGTNDRHPAGRLGARLVAGLVGGLFRMVTGPRSRVVVALAASRLSFALFGWRATVEAWTRHGSAAVAPGAEDETRAIAAGIDRLVRDIAPRLWFDVDCKERALTCRMLARRAGLEADLVIGVAFYPLSGHCWCEVATGPTQAATRLVISDDAGTCGRYTAVFRYS